MRTVIYTSTHIYSYMFTYTTRHNINVSLPCVASDGACQLWCLQASCVLNELSTIEICDGSMGKKASSQALRHLIPGNVVRLNRFLESHDVSSAAILPLYLWEPVPNQSIRQSY